MKKLYPLLLTVLFSLFLHTSFAQVVLFSFAGSNGDESDWPSAMEDAGVQPSSIGRGPGVTAVANADRFNSKGWTTGASPDLNDYIEFTITPKPGFSFSMSDITLQHQRSSTGPKSFVIRTSVDGFAADATNIVNIPDVNTNQTSTFNFPSAISSTSPITIRIYAWNAESANGTWGPGESIDGNDIMVSGSLFLLPVKFTNIKVVAREEGMLLSWSNAAETDVLFYSVERSTDGRNFSVLSQMVPSKNNGAKADYSFMDAHPAKTINYYRVKAMETNGRILYSNIIKAQNSVASTSLLLYPNPAKEGSQIVLQLTGLKTGKYHVAIYNAAGGLMHEETIAISSGSLSQTLAIDTYKKGWYLVTISGDTKLRTQLLIQ